MLTKRDAEILLLQKLLRTYRDAYTAPECNQALGFHERVAIDAEHTLAEAQHTVPPATASTLYKRRSVLSAIGEVCRELVICARCDRRLYPRNGAAVGTTQAEKAIEEWASLPRGAVRKLSNEKWPSGLERFLEGPHAD